MIAEMSLESYTNLPEQSQAVVFALSVVINRVAKLGKADREDLFELVKGLSECQNDEDRASILRAAFEIISQEPIRVSRMEMSGHETPTGLKKWADHAGAKIKEIRLAKGMRQEELAEKSGLTQSHISRLERGEHSPNHLTLTKIAKALEIEIGQLDPSQD